MFIQGFRWLKFVFHFRIHVSVLRGIGFGLIGFWIKVDFSRVMDSKRVFSLGLIGSWIWILDLDFKFGSWILVWIFSDIGFWFSQYWSVFLGFGLWLALQEYGFKNGFELDLDAVLFWVYNCIYEKSLTVHWPTYSIALLSVSNTSSRSFRLY